MREEVSGSASFLPGVTDDNPPRTETYRERKLIAGCSKTWYQLLLFPPSPGDSPEGVSGTTIASMVVCANDRDVALQSDGNAEVVPDLTV